MKKLLLFPVILLLCIHAMAQQVVINEYFNAADPRDEWSELIVTGDNVDMRGWSIRDNNSSQTSWQTGVTFSNNALWNNLRAGTIIILWHRIIGSDAVANPTDINKADGYIEVNVQNTTYFSGGSFGSSPTWAGNSLNIAGGGDVIELLNAGGTHVHALGHCSTAGSNWTAMATPKLNHANSASSGDAIYACPAAALSDYNGPATGNNFTSKNDVTITFGLPNTCGTSASGNTNYVNSLREPAIAAQTVTPSVSAPGNVIFSWTAATDPNPGDNVTGYLVLRNTVNTFTAPADGTTYTIGATLGSATVLAEINASATVTYTDNTTTGTGCYYYRVYAFRYSTDNINGNNFDDSRGRAYNQTNFVVVNCLVVLPIELINFSAKALDKKVKLSWSTASETNNDFFSIERSTDAVNFTSIAKTKGAGTSTQINKYEYMDADALAGTSYYRLKQTDFNGTGTYSGLEQVSLEATGIINVYPNPANDVLNIVLNAAPESVMVISIKNMLGATLITKEAHSSESEKTYSIPVAYLPKGLYLLEVKNNGTTAQTKFIKQ